MTHRALANLVRWQVRMHADDSGAPGSVTAQFASPGFDVYFQELFATWAAGGTLAIVPQDCRLDPDALWRWIDATVVNRLFVPVAALHLLAEARPGWRRHGSPLRRVVTAGEALQVTSAVRAMFRTLDQCRLENQYGPSETHVVASWRLGKEPDTWPARPPIGTPVDGCSVRILDRHLRPVPLEAVGEICISGAGVARGYLGRPAATAEQFRAAETPGARVYCSGDLGRQRADGVLEMVGRADRQIKLRGHRIEPGEVEAALARHPSIATATVGVHGEGADAQLVAWIVSRSGTTIGASFLTELRAHLGRILPSWMVPAAFVPLRELPLNQNGKLEREQLAPPAPMPLNDLLEPPATPLERQIAVLWAEVLGQDSIGRKILRCHSDGGMWE